MVKILTKKYGYKPAFQETISGFISFLPYITFQIYIDVIYSDRLDVIVQETMNLKSLCHRIR
jgi:hypothetical protein